MIVEISDNGRGTPCAGVLLYVLPIPVVLLLGTRRSIVRIPAVAENGDSNPPPAARRSLSSTHFAQKWQQYAAEKDRGRCAPRAVRPEACGLLSAPLRLRRREPSIRKRIARLLAQTRNLMPPAPEGRLFVRPGASRHPQCSAPRRNITRDYVTAAQGLPHHRPTSPPHIPSRYITGRYVK